MGTATQFSQYLIWFVSRLATAVRVVAGFADIHTAAHTTNEQTCCKKKQLWVQTAGPQKQPWDTLGSCRITDSACVHSSLCAKRPLSVNTGGCKDHTAATAKKISPHKRQTDNKEMSVRKFSIKIKPVFVPLFNAPSDGFKPTTYIST